MDEPVVKKDPIKAPELDDFDPFKQSPLDIFKKQQAKQLLSKSHGDLRTQKELRPIVQQMSTITPSKSCELPVNLSNIKPITSPGIIMPSCVVTRVPDILKENHLRQDIKFVLEIEEVKSHLLKHFASKPAIIKFDTSKLFQEIQELTVLLVFLGNRSIEFHIMFARV